MEDEKHTVYKITNEINGEVYIGCHVTYNINDGYMGSGTNIKKAIKKYGKENFRKEILFIFDNISDMLEKELEIVNERFIERKDTYNIVLGGGSFNVKGCVTVKDIDGNYYLVNKNDERYLSGELVGVTKNRILVNLNGVNSYVDKDDHRYLSGELYSCHMGKTIMKDKDGNVVFTNINNPRYLSGDLVGINKGKVNVSDKDGNTFQVDKNDERYLSGELTSILTGKVNVSDKDGNTFQVDKNDERYLSGELVSVHVGKMCVRDIHGNIFQVDKNDERYLSGELTSLTKNKVSVKDKDGNTFQVDKNDERYLSGELVGVTKGIGGEKSNSWGRIFIHNKKMNVRKFIKNDELDNWLSLGWERGMK